LPQHDDELVVPSLEGTGFEPSVPLAISRARC